VLLRGGRPTRTTQFPIYESRERYQSSLRLLRGISADDRTAIEVVQPYQAREHAPNTYLALLAWLNNVDKHRYVHVAFALPDRWNIRVSYGTQGEDAGYFPWNPSFVKDVRKIVEAPYIPAFTDENSAELLRVPIEPSGPDPEMKMDARATVEVALSDPKHRLILTDLRRMRGTVASIINGLRPRFDI
jgi:hypothetical protein